MAASVAPRAMDVKVSVRMARDDCTVGAMISSPFFGACDP
jgi:hypothetical protein